MFVIATGIAMLLVFSAAYLLDTSPSPLGTSSPPIYQVLWMHAEVPGSSSNTDWYDITLTVNRSVSLADFILLFINRQHVSEIPPPTFTLTLTAGSLPEGEYNFISQAWSSGAPQSLDAGDGFEVQVTNQNLIGDQLVAGGQIDFVGTSGVVFQ